MALSRSLVRSFNRARNSCHGEPEEVDLIEAEGTNEGDGVPRHLLDGRRRGPAGGTDTSVIEGDDPMLGGDAVHDSGVPVVQDCGQVGEEDHRHAGVWAELSVGELHAAAGALDDAGDPRAAARSQAVQAPPRGPPGDREQPALRATARTRGGRDHPQEHAPSSRRRRGLRAHRGGRATARSTDRPRVVGARSPCRWIASTQRQLARSSSRCARRERRRNSWIRVAATHSSSTTGRHRVLAVAAVEIMSVERTS